MHDAIGVDIGASGVRLGRVQLGRPGERHQLIGTIERPEVGSVSQLVTAITRTGRCNRVGLSVAGFVTASGAVTTSRAQPWMEGPLQTTLAERLGVTVRVVHDGEAHLFGALANIPRDRHPVIALAVGSSLAVAMTDEDGRLRRPRRDANWEFGEQRINTRASRREAWWALGRPGFNELVERDGTAAATAQFGARLGGFAAEVSGVFAARSVVLSGGIVAAHTDALGRSAREEFDLRRPWWTDAQLLISPYGHAAGVIGAAAATQSMV